MISLREINGVTIDQKDLLLNAVAAWRARSQMNVGWNCGGAEEFRCARRVVLASARYWPDGNISDLSSSSKAKRAVRGLQRDLGVTVDGVWGPRTHAAFESQVTSFPEGRDPGWGRGSGGSTGNTDIPIVSTSKKVGVIMASLGVLTVIGAGVAAWVLRRKRRA
jgi:hypothetical protein